ncbi:MAG: dTDP-4-dehydrorhamnose reductase [Acidobacteria bacterium]|nr:dTDP-4-dehydrorhamnose reductase [Acidobacteriota bacterium]MBV9184955.1 dTDP-4-dehydrorhamnose reductase [Acidobacteriota bacterium]
MRWLVTGAGGMAGRDVCAALELRGETVLPLTKSDLDIVNAVAVREAVHRTQPDVIVNCAAYTKVDEAEANEHLATAINGSAVEFLADAANDVDALLVQISTDFVFDGSKRTPYEVNDVPAPLSAYGRSKLAGEKAASIARKHIVLRTSWLFGVHGPNFVEAIRNQVRNGRKTLEVVDDQRGRPTYTPHLADAIVRLAQRAHIDENVRGIVHYADAPDCTWFDFARAIVGGEAEVLPISSDGSKRPAKRPAYSVLSTERYERITGLKPESWEEGLREYLRQRP